MSLETALAKGKQLRTIGFDDSPFDKSDPEAPVNISGVVCNATRFEGMVWGTVTRDGDDSTDEVIRLLRNSKFLPQLHLALFDGVAFGGFNVLDLPKIHEALELPCVVVMRTHPDLEAVHSALQLVRNAGDKRRRLDAAGEIYPAGEVFVQVAGVVPEHAAAAVARVTRTGHIPEPIRMAHLIGAAVQLGESGKRA